jgi:hypothetical protein
MWDKQAKSGTIPVGSKAPLIYHSQHAISAPSGLNLQSHLLTRLYDALIRRYFNACNSPARR